MNPFVRRLLWIDENWIKQNHPIGNDCGWLCDDEPQQRKLKIFFQILFEKLIDWWIQTLANKPINKSIWT